MQAAAPCTGHVDEVREHSSWSELGAVHTASFFIRPDLSGTGSSKLPSFLAWWCGELVQASGHTTASSAALWWYFCLTAAGEAAGTVESLTKAFGVKHHLSSALLHVWPCFIGIDHINDNALH